MSAAVLSLGLSLLGLDVSLDLLQLMLKLAHHLLGRLAPPTAARLYQQSLTSHSIWWRSRKIDISCVKLPAWVARAMGLPSNNSLLWRDLAAHYNDHAVHTRQTNYICTYKCWEIYNTLRVMLHNRIVVDRIFFVSIVIVEAQVSLLSSAM